MRPTFSFHTVWRFYSTRRIAVTWVHVYKFVQGKLKSRETKWFNVFNFFRLNSCCNTVPMINCSARNLNCLLMLWQKGRFLYDILVADVFTAVRLFALRIPWSYRVCDTKYTVFWRNYMYLTVRNVLFHNLMSGSCGIVSNSFTPEWRYSHGVKRPLEVKNKKSTK